MRRNVVRIPVIGQIAAGLPIPVPGDLEGAEHTETIELSTDPLPTTAGSVRAARQGLSMIDALINDGDIVLLRQQATCENGETVAVWLKDERETTLKKFYLRGQPGSVAARQHHDGRRSITTPGNVEIQGKLVTVIRPMA